MLDTGLGNIGDTILEGARRGRKHICSGIRKRRRIDGRWLGIEHYPLWNEHLEFRTLSNAQTQFGFGQIVVIDSVLKMLIERAVFHLQAAFGHHQR